ncbi:MAG: ECF transporter S component [Clostridiaceae bacterium]|nr:ECF transporter S component [Clostridiaceae bacterium]
MNNRNVKSGFTVRKVAIAGILSALSIILNFSIGFIRLPGLSAEITLMHIPVIIGAILEGPIVGMFIGLVFGLSSLYTAVYKPGPLTFVFLNPLVSVLPRILIGTVAYYVYFGLNKILGNKRSAISVGASAVLATTTNTVGVLGTIYILYAKRFMAALIPLLGLPETTSPSYIFLSAVPNYIAEVIVSVLLCIPVVLTIRKIRN